MPVAKKTSSKVEIPAIDIQHFDLTLIGDSPLICHNWSQKAKRQMLNTMMKIPNAGREAKDPVQEFEGSLYRTQDGRYGFPVVGLKASAATAALTVEGIKKSEALRSFHIRGMQVEREGSYEGLIMRDELAIIEGDEPQMREDYVRVGMGGTDLRYRAEFHNWWIKITVRHNARALTAAQIANLFNAAGFGVGIGDWRPECGGSSGMFRVATAAEIKGLRPTLRKVA